MTDQTSIEVGVVMGSPNDWETMRAAADVLAQFDVGHEVRVMSAHRAPDLVAEYAATAEQRGLNAIIAGAGMAAHLAGVIAAKTIVPVLGVPIQSPAMQGLDSLLSTVQMPKGIPVATFAIGRSGAGNAALYAVAMLATTRPDLRDRLAAFRRDQTQKVVNLPDPRTQG